MVSSGRSDLRSEELIARGHQLSQCLVRAPTAHEDGCGRSNLEERVRPHLRTGSQASHSPALVIGQKSMTTSAVRVRDTALYLQFTGLRITQAVGWLRHAVEVVSALKKAVSVTP